ncbi:MFS transporter [Corynebacterium sp. A21]|uniref:MFS transporter n=1 Tax=Corynebacterium sp. A21 TaxID=3457318 RepID=UPI003FD25680
MTVSTPPQQAMRTDKRTVTAWGLWDWGSAALNAVLITFIFSVYLTDSVGQNIGETVNILGLDITATPAQWYGWAMGAAGVGVALLAPVMGQRSDIRGTRKRGVALWTMITVVLMAMLVSIRNDDASYFWLGITILAVASVTFELAEVNYFAMLKQVSTPENVGRVSGFGWSMGYFGGIVLLLACFLGFVSGSGETRGVLGLPAEGGFNIRMVALFAAVWFFVFALPVFFRVPEIPPSGEKSLGIIGSYRKLFSDLAELWREDRNAVFFLISSAVFRDGLAGVFTFGAILAVLVYGLSPGDVLLFGVAANVFSAIGAVLGGWLDDRIGPKPVILGSLGLMIIAAAVLYFVEGPTMFWIFGLMLCIFVGPAQSASRTFLSRIAPEGRDGQMFGLYATTGRSVSWMTPLVFGWFVGWFGDDRAGIIGIGVVLAVGALLLLGVRKPTGPKTPLFDAA